MNLLSSITFLGASAALTIAPGPDNTFIVAQGVSRGRRAALVTAWGMCSGITVHTLAAALGISALFYSSEIAFQAVKFAGAGYLLYLAWRALRERTPAEAKTAEGGPTLFALYRRGFLMNVLNPKVALFFLAFLPQFVSADADGVWLQMVILGLLFMAQAVAIFTVIALASGVIGDRILKNQTAAKWFSWLAAAIFVALAVRLAFASR